MAAGSKIEWTDGTWNPVRGCTRVSSGCGGPGPHGGCYAEIMAARFSNSAEELRAEWIATHPGEQIPTFRDQWGHGFAEMRGGDHRWTGKVALVESQIDLPLRWKTPRRIFVNSTSDLFHEALPDEAVDRVFAVMAATPHHTYQVLTKRPERMRAYLSDVTNTGTRIARHWLRLAGWGKMFELPLTNVWLGVSVEDQERADERIPLLLQTPAAVRFLSCEPLLGAIDLTDALAPAVGRPFIPLHWVIAGGESGHNARPMHPEWARALRDQCTAAGVPFFFKQWGEWIDADNWLDLIERGSSTLLQNGREWRPVRPLNFDSAAFLAAITGRGGKFEHLSSGHTMIRVDKHPAGRVLDGREWNEFPRVTA